MKKINKPLITLILTLFLIWIFFKYVFSQVPSVTHLARQAQPVSLMRLGTDKKFDFNPISDRFKIVHFWATWCAPCIDEFPEFIKTAKLFEHEAVEWIAVSLDKNSDDVESFLKGITLPKNVIILHDPNQIASDLYGSYHFPETFLIKPSGEIIFKWVGSQPWNDPDFIKKLKQVF